MKKRIKSMIGFIAVCAFCVMTLSGYNTAKASTDISRNVAKTDTVERALDKAESENEGDVIGIGVIAVQSTAQSAVSAKSSSANANIVGDGVRLRKKPTTSSTVLGLMYNNENVCINFTKSSQVKGWYYVKRIKTGTWGWVKKTYVYPWD